MKTDVFQECEIDLYIYDYRFGFFNLSVELEIPPYVVLTIEMTHINVGIGIHGISNC